MRIKKPPTNFVICIRNCDYSASLEVRKIYECIPDASAEVKRHIRVIDESGEDYLYPMDYFMPIALPAPVTKALEKSKR